MNDNSPESGNAVPEDVGFVQLLRIARAGDQTALGKLMESCRDYLLLIANEDLDRDLQGKFGASDFVQESFLAAHRNFGQFRGQTAAEFKGWLRQILRNDLNQTRRAFFSTDQRNIRREQEITDPQNPTFHQADHFLTPSSDAVANEERRLLEWGLTQLPVEYRDVIRMRNWEQMGFAEIGLKLNISDDAARKLWYRAVLKLESLIQEGWPKMMDDGH